MNPSLDIQVNLRMKISLSSPTRGEIALTITNQPPRFGDTRRRDDSSNEQ